MKCRLLIALLLGGVLLTLLAGCYGHSPGLDPVIKIELPGKDDPDTFPVIGSETILTARGEVTANHESDVVVSQRWTQRSDVAGAPMGSFLIVDSYETNWLAPVWYGPGYLPITLTFTVDTSMGGHASRDLHLLIAPAVQTP